ncbi:glycerol kinase GlpK [Ancylomarina sp. 16SWW S1-10-2]|uniref:glycerol kinase GlpK n=1 Tax=Ancylomarina sp. 16SWW S1-10-2 TaxID=2499681 RepID=UPI0012AE7118|nr:glycerol kinase GlpK [Ancylomarina sp. 16SWW S1-10-2]MRT94699.1 glycerol kinase [Ancylomarina sp. 16SWW S1-10-2]
MQQYILSLDQGTSISRAIIFDIDGKIIAISQKEFEQNSPQLSWIEQDANEIWYSQASVAEEVIAKAGLTAKDIKAIGITNQRETTILWDKETGKPIANAIVWQDLRTSKYCEELKKRGLTDTIKEKTGLILDAYFSGTKIKWLLDNIPGARQKAKEGKLAFGTVDSWLIWKLTKGACHVTDVSNASRTMLFNIRTLEWDKEILDILDIPESILPEVKSSSEVYGMTSKSLFGEEIPIAGICGDQQAALFGQMCFEKGMVKNTYNTGCFILMNTGDQIVTSKNDLITTIAWQIGDKVTYALEGSVFIGGAVIQWLRDQMNLIHSLSEIEELALSEKDNGGVYIVPAFMGLGAPYWDQYARGTFWGLNMGTTPGHIARAALESIALRSRDVLKAMERDSGNSLTQLRAGGAVLNKTLMQFQADILDIPVVSPNVKEITALGSAYLAGLAVGFWKDIDEIKKHRKITDVYEAKMSKDKLDKTLKYWNRAVGRTSQWLDSDD